MDGRKIGVFDSGVGGLTVVKEVLKNLPHEEIIYFGDTARVPYGTKSRRTVLKYSVQIMNFLTAQDIKAAIIACGTISSNCRDELRRMYGVPMADVFTAGAEACVSATVNGSVGVIGTERTIKSGAFERRINELDPRVSVCSKACPLFVPLAEEGWFDNAATQLIADIYLREFAERGIDTLLLGCTHYPLLADCIKKVTGGVNIIDPSEAAALAMKELLTETDSLREPAEEPENIFYISDDTDKFDLISRRVLKKEFPAIKIDIEDY